MLRLVVMRALWQQVLGMRALGMSALAMRALATRAVLSVLIGCLVGMSGSSALAQEVYDDASADALFESAMAKMKAGAYAEACELIERSLEVDYGMAAQFRLAECYEKLGRTASSQRTYLAVKAAAEKRGQPDRAAMAAERAAALERRLTKLSVVVPAANKGLNGLTILIDGEPLPSDKWGQAAAVDPGEHEVKASAPGYQAWGTTVSASNPGETQTIHVPPLPKEGEEAPLSAPQASEDESKQGLIGILVGGAGIVMMGVGGVLGLVAKSSYDGVAESCGEAGCNSNGFAVRSSARSTGTVGTVLVSVGAATTAAGVVIWLTEPTATEPTAGLRLVPTPGGAALSIGGRF